MILWYPFYTTLHRNSLDYELTVYGWTPDCFDLTRFPLCPMTPNRPFVYYYHKYLQCTWTEVARSHLGIFSLIGCFLMCKKVTSKKDFSSQLMLPKNTIQPVQVTISTTGPNISSWNNFSHCKRLTTKKQAYLRGRIWTILTLSVKFLSHLGISNLLKRFGFFPSL